MYYISSWLGYNNHNNDYSDNINDKDDTEEIINEIPEIPEIPDSTDNYGSIYMYYKINDSDILNIMKSYNDRLETNTIKIIKVLPWTIILNKIRRRPNNYSNLLKSYHNTFTTIKDIEVIRINHSEHVLPGLEFGDSNEFINNTNNKIITCQIDRSDIFRRSNITYGTRFLYILDWKFKLHLNDDWLEEFNSVNHKSMEKITHNPYKINLYLVYIHKYIDICKNGILFREKHYTTLKNPSIVNDLDNLYESFIADLIDLFEQGIDMLYIFDMFYSKLNPFERKRYHKYKKPFKSDIQITLNWKCNATYSE